MSNRFSSEQWNNFMNCLKQLGEENHLPQDWLNHTPHLFSPASVSLSSQQQWQISNTVTAIERVIANPDFRNYVMRWASPSAHKKSACLGVFMGYDFHITPEGIQLIEINTNAGGAGLNLLLRKAYTQSYPEKKLASPYSSAEALWAIFLHEWTRFCGGFKDSRLKRIAIVDHHPKEQYLYAEFLLFQTLFQEQGVEAILVDPTELEYRQSRLYHQDLPIDLVYNRLTDFSLDAPEHAALLKAYLEDVVAITPNPYVYALYADKRNLTVLSDTHLLTEFGVDANTREILKRGIPRTFKVVPECEAQLWADRKHLFFKPFLGYGSKGVYSGQKLTRRVFAEILQGGYLAQFYAPADKKTIFVDDQPIELKYDLRCYTYAGKIHDQAVRFYSGQTTNARTLYGGFGAILSDEG